MGGFEADERDRVHFSTQSTVTIVGTDPTSEAISIMISLLLALITLLLLLLVVYVCVRRVRNRRNRGYKELAVIPVLPPPTTPFLLNSSGPDVKCCDVSVLENGHQHSLPTVTSSKTATMKYQRLP